MARSEIVQKEKTEITPILVGMDDNLNLDELRFEFELQMAGWEIV